MYSTSFSDRSLILFIDCFSFSVLYYFLFELIVRQFSLFVFRFADSHTYLHSFVCVLFFSMPFFMNLLSTKVAKKKRKKSSQIQIENRIMKMNSHSVQNRKWTLKRMLLISLSSFAVDQPENSLTTISGNCTMCTGTKRKCFIKKMESEQKWVIIRFKSWIEMHYMTNHNNSLDVFNWHKRNSILFSDSFQKKENKILGIFFVQLFCTSVPKSQ